MGKALDLIDIVGSGEFLCAGVRKVANVGNVGHVFVGQIMIEEAFVFISCKTWVVLVGNAGFDAHGVHGASNLIRWGISSEF